MAARIFVFGSYFADMVMATPRLPRRGETIAGGPFRTSHGGKGSNQAVAARRAGAEVVFATRLGDDDAGRAALRFHAEEGIDARHVAIDRDGVATGAALIMVEDGSAENMIALAMGACGHFTDAEVDAAVAGGSDCAVALFQLETNLGATLRAIRAMRAAGARTILNPAPARDLPADIYPHVDVLTPNETEASMLAGVDASDEAGIREAVARERQHALRAHRHDEERQGDADQRRGVASVLGREAAAAPAPREPVLRPRAPVHDQRRARRHAVAVDRDMARV
ncbi:MAG: ribokinase, partial [Alphaproteobacteria bacterium]